MAKPSRSFVVRTTVTTPVGTVRARAVILTVSTAVLTGDAVMLPAELDPWRRATSLLPLGRNEKLFLEIVGEGPFASETAVFGNPREARTGACYIRPFGGPVIECFFGGEGARLVEESGPASSAATRSGESPRPSCMRSIIVRAAPTSACRIARVASTSTMIAAFRSIR
jgi:hypothetical protein